MRNAELFSLLFWITEKHFYTFVLVGQDMFIRNLKTINSYSKKQVIDEEKTVGKMINHPPKILFLITFEIQMQSTWNFHSVYKI